MVGGWWWWWGGAICVRAGSNEVRDGGWLELEMLLLPLTGPAWASTSLGWHKLCLPENLPRIITLHVRLGISHAPMMTSELEIEIKQLKV